MGIRPGKGSNRRERGDGGDFTHARARDTRRLGRGRADFLVEEPQKGKAYRPREDMTQEDASIVSREFGRPGFRVNLSR